MKQYTSRTLKTIAVTYLLFPLIYILATAILFDIPANLCLRILISPTYYLAAIPAIIAGYGLWEMRRWGWYVFILVNIITIYLSALYLHDYGESHHKVLAFLFFACFLGGLTLRVGKEVRVPYFLPRIRWWESNPRYRLSLPVSIVDKTGQEISGEILDLSMGGCFIKLKVDIQKDETVLLKFSAFGYQVICQGTVVWRAVSAVTHPKGLGIKFSPLQKTEKRNMRLITKRYKKISTYYRKFRYLMNQEDFLKKMQELENNGSVTLRRTG